MLNLRFRHTLAKVCLKLKQKLYNHFDSFFFLSKNLFFQAEEELYGAHAQPQKPLMKAGASVLESAESGIELSASAQSGTW